VTSATLLRLIRQGRSFSGHERHCCFLNTGQTRFANVSAATHLDFDDDGRAVGRVDWDRDGDLDLWISNRNAPQVRFLRNDVPHTNHFLAMRLQGTTCNRDAIGARVEVILKDDNSARLVKSLSAGDGYLAESTKWLVFGLGTAAEIDRVLVRWPDGAVEEFRGLVADHHYHLVQGSGVARRWVPPARDVELKPCPIQFPAGDAKVELLSAARVLLPRLSYVTFDHKTVDVSQPGGKPVLLNLWASWCKPCLVELSGLAADRDKLIEAGVDVVALTVDGIDKDDAASKEAAQRVLNQLGFPFRSGMASPELIEKLQLANNLMFDLHLPLPVPTSVLIDSEGRLAGLYKGGLSTERLLSDVDKVSLDGEARRGASVPFAGRWHERPNSLSLIPLLDQLVQGGFLEEADDYVRRMGTVRKSELLPALVRLGMALYRRGDRAKAQEHFAMALRMDRTFVGVEIQLGLEREREGRPESAVALYREALRRDPKNVEALNNLAWLLSTSADDKLRSGEEALKLAQQAAEATSRRDPRVLDTLAAAYAEAGQFEKAVQIGREAVELSRSRGQLALAQQIENRHQMYTRREPCRTGR
jgi:tetratricopeptide (TPR) repeat protein